MSSIKFTNKIQLSIFTFLKINFMKHNYKGRREKKIPTFTSYRSIKNTIWRYPCQKKLKVNTLTKSYNIKTKGLCIQDAIVCRKTQLAKYCNSNPTKKFTVLYFPREAQTYFPDKKQQSKWHHHGFGVITIKGARSFQNFPRYSIFYTQKITNQGR